MWYEDPAHSWLVDANFVCNVDIFLPFRMKLFDMRFFGWCGRGHEGEKQYRLIESFGVDMSSNKHVRGGSSLKWLDLCDADLTCHH